MAFSNQGLYQLEPSYLFSIGICHNSRWSVELCLTKKQKELQRPTSPNLFSLCPSSTVLPLPSSCSTSSTFWIPWVRRATVVSHQFVWATPRVLSIPNHSRSAGARDSLVYLSLETYTPHALLLFRPLSSTRRPHHHRKGRFILPFLPFRHGRWEVSF